MSKHKIIFLILTKNCLCPFALLILSIQHWKLSMKFLSVRPLKWGLCFGFLILLCQKNKTKQTKKALQYTFRGWVIWLHVSSFPHLRHYRWHSLSAKHKPHLVVSDVPELIRAPYNLWISVNVTVIPFQVNIGNLIQSLYPTGLLDSVINHHQSF